MLNSLDFQSFRVFFHDASIEIHCVRMRSTGSVQRTQLTAVQMLSKSSPRRRYVRAAAILSAIGAWGPFYWS
jgi:hypothetical protein